MKSLRKAVLNEGLEVLGTNELTPDGKLYPGVFFVSGLRDVKFPSTLKRIEYRAFMGCWNLKTVRFPEGLEYLGVACFSITDLESVDFPASLRTISQEAFFQCENLKSARFAGGLEVLGTDDKTRCGVFGLSALESVELPATLKRIEYEAFTECNNLKTVELPDRLEYLGC